MRPPRLSGSVRQTVGGLTSMTFAAKRQNLTLPIALFVAMGVVACATGRHGQLQSTSTGAGSDEVVTITNSCGVMDPVRFIGRVVHRAPDGTLKPIADATITRSRDAGFLTAGFEAKRYRTDREGRFDIAVVRGVESTQVVDGRQTRESEIIEEVTFTFDAPGCGSVQWRLTLDEQPVTIEMKCPGTSTGVSGGESRDAV